MPRAPPISSPLILPYSCLIRCTSRVDPQHTIFPVSCCLLHLRSNNYIPLSILLSNSPQAFLNVTDQASHPYKTTDKITVLYILVIMFFMCKSDDKIRILDQWTETVPYFNLLLIFQACNCKFSVSLPNVWTLTYFRGFRGLYKFGIRSILTEGLKTTVALLCTIRTSAVYPNMFW